jgi:hypothetical protein
LDQVLIKKNYFLNIDGSRLTSIDLSIKFINNNEWMVIRNSKGRFGIVRVDGQFVLPFDYDSIAEENNQIFVRKNEVYQIFEIQPDGLLLLD